MEYGEWEYGGTLEKKWRNESKSEVKTRFGVPFLGSWHFGSGELVRERKESHLPLQTPPGDLPLDG